ncbi:MAG: CBS domain-containing protein [Marmoricola sp.]
MLRISDVLSAKPSDVVVTVQPTATVRELLTLLEKHNIGALVVSHDGDAVEGIVSERDIVRRLAHNADLLDASVRSIMTTDVRTIAPDDTIEETRQLMTDKRVRHLPVIVDGHLQGLVSIGDIVKSHIAQVEYERDQLDSYVRS